MKTLPILACIIALADACTPSQRIVAKTAVDAAEDACRFAFGQHPEELPAGVSLEEFCHTAEHFQPFLDSILSAHHAVVSKLPSKSPADAGTD